MTSPPYFSGATEPAFARHETFAPRFGWLRKAFAGVTVDREVFLRPDAPVELGVGKNMVNAIRYWSQAFKLTIEVRRSGTSRAAIVEPTWASAFMFSEEGADPYLEDPASLWLLHWWLLSPPSKAPTWWAAFNTPAPYFHEDSLLRDVCHQVEMAGWPRVSESSIVRDIDCLTKMYAQRKGSPGSPGSFEDALGSPFRELGLLSPMPNTPRAWRFAESPRRLPPEAVVAFTCLDYISRQGTEPGSRSIASLALDLGGPGRVMRLREADLKSTLEAVAEKTDQLYVVDSVGSSRLVFEDNPVSLSWRLLNDYYGDPMTRIPGVADWILEISSSAQSRSKHLETPMPTVSLEGAH